MALTVVGIFDDAAEARQAVETLVSEGFLRDSIDLSAQTGTYSEERNSTGEAFPDQHRNTSGTRTEELADDAKDVGSGIGGFFSSLFGNGDDEGDKYARVADRGSVVTVHTSTEEEAERAADILDDAGAVDVNERAAEYGYTSVGMTTGDVDNTTSLHTTDSDQTIQVIEENLEVGKRDVERGGVRVRSRIVSKPVEESVRLREERVSVTRTPVNRTATDADLTAFREGEISLTEHAEVPVVSKTANVIEEITVGKEVTEREEIIRDTVRNTEVDVEELGTTDKLVRPTGTDSDEITYSTK